MTWRLGLKVGTNTIGWAALEFVGRPPAPARITGSGVRVFSDGRRTRDRQPNAVARRISRQKRKLRSRTLKRRRRFMEALILHGLMTGDAAERKTLEKLDPWILRVRALDEKLTMHELGRALFHLQQRRGFRFNRRTDKVMAIRRLTADAARRALNAPPDTRFGLEAGSRKHIEGDRTATVLARSSAWGKPWRRLPLTDEALGRVAPNLDNFAPRDPGFLI